MTSTVTLTNNLYSLLRDESLAFDVRVYAAQVCIEEFWEETEPVLYQEELNNVKFKVQTEF